ncbi:MAG: IPT/TIG domain-containing protein [bacterium]
MKKFYLMLSLLLIVGVIAGCGGGIFTNTGSLSSLSTTEQAVLTGMSGTATAVAGSATSVNGTTTGMSTLAVATPSITSVTPNTNVAPGTDVVIAGTNFGTSGGAVYLGTDPNAQASLYVAIKSWSDTSITIVAPPGDNGTYQVNVGVLSGSGYQWSTETTKTLQLVNAGPPTGPTVTDTSPRGFGLPGSSVTITGTNFGATQGTSVVYFGSTSNTGTVVTWSNTSIVVTVPNIITNKTAVAATIFVKVGTQYSNGFSFTVVPRIEDVLGAPDSEGYYTPPYSPPGKTVKIRFEDENDAVTTRFKYADHLRVIVSGTGIIAGETMQFNERHNLKPETTPPYSEAPYAPAYKATGSGWVKQADGTEVTMTSHTVYINRTTGLVGGTDEYSVTKSGITYTGTMTHNLDGSHTATIMKDGVQIGTLSVSATGVATFTTTDGTVISVNS